MPVHRHIGVHVTVDGQPLQEYPVPDGEEADEDQIVRYIESIVGQRFQVSVRWLPGFDLKNATNLVTSLSLDGVRWIPKSPIACRGLQATSDGVLTRESSYIFGHGQAALEDGSRKRLYYTFGSLELTESAIAPPSLSPEEVKNLGEIKVTIYRGRKTMIGGEWIEQEVPRVHDEIPEKMLKGRLLKNTVKNVETHRSIRSLANKGFRYDVSEIDCEPSSRKWTCKPKPGSAGRVRVFVFKYRNRNQLQQLGCIPRTPSPEPDHSVITERQEELIKQTKAEKRQANLEILRLRQRIAQLEGSNDSLSTHRGTKRERQEDDDEVEEVASPPKRATPMIDLTEDN